MAYRNQTPISPITRCKSLAFVLLYNLLGMAHGVLCLMVGPFLAFERRYRFVNLWTRATIWLLRHFNGVTIEVRGRDNIPADGRFVVVANHQSQWETFYLQLLFSPQATILKRELLWVPFFGWGLALLEPIRIDRGRSTSALKQIIQQGKVKLSRGIPIVIFPEGSRQSPGELGPFSNGGAMLATNAGVPVLPIAHNAGDCWPARSLLRIPGRIIISIGEPITTEGRKSRAINDLSRDWIQSEYNAISRELGLPEAPVADNPADS